MTLSIKSKLYLGFGLLVAMTLGLVGYAVWQSRAMAADVGTMTLLQTNVGNAAAMEDNFEKMRRSGLTYVYNFDESSLKENDAAGTALIGLMQKAARDTPSEARRKAYQDLLDGVAAVRKKIQAWSDSIKQLEKDKVKLSSVGDSVASSTHALLGQAQSDSNAKFLSLSETLETQVLMVREANWRTQATLTSQALADFRQAIAEASTTVAGFDKAGLPPTMRAMMIAPLKTDLEAYATTAESVIEKLQQSREFWNNDISPSIAKMQATIVTAKSTLEGGFSTARTAVEATLASNVLIQQIIAGLALVIGGAIAFFVARGISNPIRALTGGMRKLADGQFDVVLPGLGRKDEIGEIAGAVETFKVKAAERARHEAEEKVEQDRRADAEREAALAKMAEEFQATVGGIVQAAIAGDFSQRVALEGRSGLVLNVGSAINSLCENVAMALDDLSQMLAALAEGNMTQRITADYQGNFATLKDNANTTAQRIGMTVAEIKRAAHEVTNASAEISSSTTDLSQRTEEQAASLEQTSASMEQISATVKKNAENAQEANRSADGTRKVADRGGEVVAKAVDAMARIEESSRKISDIIGVIDEIARQTNLLALNAAVEAARAGEAGRGFAVVASEVRSLAQRSSQAAKDIKDLITNSNSQVQEGVQLVNQAGTSLTEIVASIKTVAHFVADIASASAEQASGLDQINKALTHMDEATQQNSALVEENAATAKVLEHQAQAMDDRVGFFQLDEDATDDDVVLPAAATGSSAGAPARRLAPKPVARGAAGPVRQMRTTLATTVSDPRPDPTAGSIGPDAALDEEIKDAIGAHGKWKMRLHIAIETGKADAEVGEVAKDDVCAFGKWLYGPTIPASMRAGADYASIRALHAKFHKCAAKVLDDVTHGHKAQAEALMAGEYAAISGELTAALMKWRASGN